MAHPSRKTCGQTHRTHLKVAEGSTQARHSLLVSLLESRLACFTGMVVLCLHRTSHQTSLPTQQATQHNHDFLLFLTWLRHMLSKAADLVTHRSWTCCCRDMPITRAAAAADPASTADLRGCCLSVGILSRCASCLALVTASSQRLADRCLHSYGAEAGTGTWPPAAVVPAVRRW